jgi:hypothetical protein
MTDTPPVGAALVDVGGTLWPDTWPISKADAEERRNALAALFPRAEQDRLEALPGTSRHLAGPRGSMVA